MDKNLNLRGKLHAYDWLEGIEYAPDESSIVQVLFKNTRSGFYANPDRIPLKKGDWVAVEASPGYDIGKVMLTGSLVRLCMKKSNVASDAELKKVYRIATEADFAKFDEARAREHDTMIRSRQIALDLGLDMKIGDVEYQGDGTKAIFYYIADERVDFRKLIRVLADAFHIRIEMKQIGARQEAGRIGGIGPCGRPLCCSSWMQKFVSVGTGAARIQDLSMNPQKLAGQCAKLKCCLNFETDAYAEAAKDLPPKDAVLITQDTEYYQFKTDILAHTITYSTDKHLAVNLVTISASRAFEIIELNKQGLKPETLEEPVEEVVETKEYVEIVGQDSLTRFDKSKAKRSREQEKKSREQEKKGNREQGKKSPREQEKKNSRDQDRKSGREQEKKNSREQDKKASSQHDKKAPAIPKQQQAGEQKPGGQGNSQNNPRRTHNARRGNRNKGRIDNKG